MKATKAPAASPRKAEPVPAAEPAAQVAQVAQVAPVVKRGASKPPHFPKSPAKILEMPPLPLVGRYAEEPPRSVPAPVATGARRAETPKAVPPALPPLPVVTDTPPTPVSTHDEKGARSLLVVEDDEATRRLMVRALRTQYTVYEASNGEEAAHMLDVHPGVDCVVSDIMMPKLTGTELAQKMKSDSRLAKVPIVFVTAKKGAGEGIEAFTLGVKHYLRKPFKLRELLDTVGSVMKKAY
jgi:CheY-like chemotaxis protein